MKNKAAIDINGDLVLLVILAVMIISFICGMYKVLE